MILAVKENVSVTQMITHKEGIIVGFIVNSFFDILTTYSNQYIPIFGLKNFELKEVYASFRKHFSVIIDKMKIVSQHFYSSSTFANLKHIDILVGFIWLEINPLRSRLSLHPCLFIINCLSNGKERLEPLFFTCKSSLRKRNVKKQLSFSFFVGDFKWNGKPTIHNLHLIVVFYFFKQFFCIPKDHEACSFLLNEFVRYFFQVYPPS